MVSLILSHGLFSFFSHILNGEEISMALFVLCLLQSHDLAISALNYKVIGIISFGVNFSHTVLCTIEISQNINFQKEHPYFVVCLLEGGKHVANDSTLPVCFFNRKSCRQRLTFWTQCLIILLVLTVENSFAR